MSLRVAREISVVISEVSDGETGEGYEYVYCNEEK